MVSVPIISPGQTIRGYGLVVVTGSYPFLAYLLGELYPVDVFIASSDAPAQEFVQEFLSEHDPPWELRDVRYVRQSSSLLLDTLDQFLYYDVPLRH